MFYLMNYYSRRLTNGCKPLFLWSSTNQYIQTWKLVENIQLKLYGIFTNNHLHRHHLLSRSLSTTSTTRAMSYPIGLSRQPDNFQSLGKQAWKEAASLIILTKNDQPKTTNSSDQKGYEFDYELLMVKRSSGSSFFASAFVFPGGQVELSDFDRKWYSLFDKLQVDRKHLDEIWSAVVGPRPPIITDSITLKNIQQPTNNFIHLDLGLRISAIRETFEEAGILLLIDPKNINEKQTQNEYCPIHTSQSLQIDLADWQMSVRNDSQKFYELCDRLEMVPNLWALYEWSNWLTPVNVGHRRFDTIFYVCCFEKKPPVAVDNAEITKPLWCNPISVLMEHQQEQVFLAPPQVYEISRMLQFQDLDRFLKFMKSRQSLGIQRWLPVIYTYDDGALSLVPGDERYPLEPELVSTKPVADVQGSIHEANTNDKYKNRMELQGIRCRTLCTIEPGCGHLPPITFPLETTNPINDNIAKL